MNIKYFRNIWILIVIFTIIFFIPRLFYLFYFPYPFFSPDSFDYYYTAHLILNKNFADISTLPIDLPMGYPLFLAVMESFAHNINSVIAVQIFIGYFAYLLFILSIYKFEPKLVLPIIVSLSLYSLDGWTLETDTSILTESLFVSSILIFSATLFWVINNYNSKTRILLLSLFTFIPIFIRSNGIFVYIIIVFLILFFIIKKAKISSYLFLIVPIVVLNIFFAIFTLSFTKGVGFPGNIFRLRSVINYSASKINNNEINNNDNFSENLVKYVRMPNCNYFFHDKIIQRYTRLVSNFNKTDSCFMFDKRIAVPENIKALVFKEFYQNSVVFTNPKNQINNSVVLRLFKTHIKFYNLFIRNIVFFILFFIASVFIIYTIIFKKIYTRQTIFLLYLSLLYLFNLIFISFYVSGIRHRYVLIFDFAVYIVVFFFLFQLFQLLYFKLFHLKKNI